MYSLNTKFKGGKVEELDDRIVCHIIKRVFRTPQTERIIVSQEPPTTNTRAAHGAAQVFLLSLICLEQSFKFKRPYSKGSSFTTDFSPVQQLNKRYMYAISNDNALRINVPTTTCCHRVRLLYIGRLAT